jgi:hypothetical protein
MISGMYYRTIETNQLKKLVRAGQGKRERGKSVDGRSMIPIDKEGTPFHIRKIEQIVGSFRTGTNNFILTFENLTCVETTNSPPRVVPTARTSVSCQSLVSSAS